MKTAWRGPKCGITRSKLMRESQNSSKVCMSDPLFSETMFPRLATRAAKHFVCFPLIQPPRETEQETGNVFPTLSNYDLVVFRFLFYENSTLLLFKFSYVEVQQFLHNTAKT